MNTRTTVAVRSVQGARDEQADAAEWRHSDALTIAVLCDGIADTPDARDCANQAAKAAKDYLAVLPRHRAKAVQYLHRLPGAVSARLDRRVERQELAAGAATSLVAVAITKEVCWVLSVGDCRATLIRSGAVLESTVPHNLAYQVWLDGQNADSRSHEQLARSLTRSITAGSSEPVFAPSVSVWSVRPADLIVLTTDGVHETISLREFALDAPADDADRAADDALARVVASHEHGDNATVCCIALGQEGRR